jgi:hypothetical protein
MLLLLFTGWPSSLNFPFSQSQSQSQSYFTILAPGPLRPTTNIFFQLNTRDYCLYVTYCLTRGCVCRQSFSGPCPAGLMDILLSLIRDSLNMEGQVPVFISPRNSVAQLYHQHWVPFLSLPTIPGLRWRYSTPPPHGCVLSVFLGFSLCSLRAYPQKTPFLPLSQQYLNCCLRIRCRGNMFTETLLAMN